MIGYTVASGIVSLISNPPEGSMNAIDILKARQKESNDRFIASVMQGKGVFAKAQAGMALLRIKASLDEDFPVTEILRRGWTTEAGRDVYVGAIWITASMAQDAVTDTANYFDAVQADARQIIERAKKEGRDTTEEEKRWYDQWNLLWSEFENWRPERIGFKDPKVVHDTALSYRERAKVMSDQLEALGVVVAPRPAIPKPTEFHFPSIPWVPILIMVGIIAAIIIVPPLIKALAPPAAATGA